MENLQHTVGNMWNVFVTSNMFNFVIFVSVFAFIFKKFNFKGMLESLQQKVADVIESAKKAKEEAQKELSEAQKATANLDSELKSIVEDAEKSANVISEKILNEAQKQLKNIEENATKIIEAEERMLVSSLTKNTSKASVEIAKMHIKNVLEQNPTLQEKYINESINEIDRLNF